MTKRHDSGNLTPALAELSKICPQRCTTGASVCDQHAGTLTGLPKQPPDAVVYPETIEEVQAIVQVANRHRMPVIAFGAGTSLEGQVNAPCGGVSIDLSRMARIVRVGESDLDVTVEPGVTLDQLNTALRATGLLFPVDPGAGTATLGGMASTRASGTTTVRYGAMRENVLSMKVVLADGTLVSTGSRARKSAAGYDLTRLFIGAEGTLGIIVELTLRLHPRPETLMAGIAAFSSVTAAAGASAGAVQAGLAMQRIELLDPAMLRIINRASGTNLPADGPALFVEVAGTPASVAEHIEAFMAIVWDQGGTWLRDETSEDGRRALWKARHDAFWSIRTAYPGRSFLVTDVCVPVSRLAECLDETVRDLEENSLIAPIVGHVGDGNFHTVLVCDPGDDDRRIKAYLDRLVTRALRMEGTCTGEHGIGQGKARYLAVEAGPALGVMRQIKSALDPLGILNPGKYV
jgi:D-lactate dehydrogenase (cytochrome)